MARRAAEVSFIDDCESSSIDKTRESLARVSSRVSAHVAQVFSKSEADALHRLPSAFHRELLAEIEKKSHFDRLAVLKKLSDLPLLNHVELAACDDLVAVRRYADKMYFERWVGRSDLTQLQWRRRTLKLWRQQRGAMALHLGLVGYHSRYRYTSDVSVESRAQQRRAWDSALKKRIFTNSKSGESRSLFELVGDSRDGRLAELYAYCTALAREATDMGFRWVAITLTAPPRFHPSPAKGRDSWDGSLPDASHQYIFERWRSAYKRIKRAKIPVCGLRVVEPCQDGCAHWHVMLWGALSDLAKIKTVLEDYFSLEKEEDEDRPSHLKYNDQRDSTFTHCDEEKKPASFAWYMMKYLTKAVGKDVHGIDKKNSVERVDAWRSDWAIRGYQFFGVPSFSAWRLMRKCKDVPEDSRLLKIYQAAHEERPNVAAYFEQQGGICRKQYPVRVDDDVKTTRRAIRADYNARISKLSKRIGKPGKRGWRPWGSFGRVHLARRRIAYREQREEILESLKDVKPTEIFVRNFETDGRTAAIVSDWVENRMAPT